MEEMFLALKDRAVQLLKGFKGDDYTFGIGVLQDVELRGLRMEQRLGAGQ